MNQSTTALPVLLFIAALSVLFVAGLAMRILTDLRGPVGTGHHCQPGTCGVCDTFGTWSD